MKPEQFEVVVSELAPDEADSLERDFSRAALRAGRRGGGTSIVVASRRNAVFSVDDVLEVLAEWIEKRPARFATITVEVRRASRLPLPAQRRLLATR